MNRPHATTAAAAVLVALLAGCTLPSTSAPQTAPNAAPADVGVEPPLVAQARAALPNLPVNPGTGHSGYTRAAYGQAWTDNTDAELGHNGCDTRNDILARDADPGTVRYKPGTRNCKVTAGRWTSPYTGAVVTSRGGVQIDHVVPLAYSWAHGAAQWSAEDRKRVANDPLNLLAVDGHSNQAKGDSGPAEWQPPRRAAWCDYAVRFVLVADAYRLSVTAADRLELGTMFRTCGTR